MSFEDKISKAIGAVRTDEVADAARWRGQCVDCYAQIEFLVGTALRELWSTGLKKPPQPPFTYRTKMVALRDAVSEHGCISDPLLFRTLDQLHAACDRRNLIVHASGTVSQTPSGDWIWMGCYLPADRETDIVAKAITRSDAELLETDLKRKIQSLTSQLLCLRKKAVTK